MAYIKLDKIKTHYNVSSDSSVLIVSEIIDSGCSYEIPKLISTQEDLEIYFGTSFSMYDYYIDLLSQGVNFLLYRPVSGKDTSPIDLSDYVEYFNYNMYGDNLGFYNESDLPQDKEIKKSKYKFWVINDSAYYIWDSEYDTYVNASILPEKEILSSSEINRDTLRLTTPKFGNEEGLFFCHPKYSSRIYTPEYEEIINDEFKESILGSLRDFGNDVLEGNTYTLALDLDFSEVDNIDDSCYLVLKDKKENTIQYYFDSSVDQSGLYPLGDDIIDNSEDNSIRINTESCSLTEIIEKLMIKIEENYNVIKRSDTLYTIISSNLIKNLKFYNISGLKINSNYEVTNNVLSIISEDNKRVEFFSKTIGKNDENIKIKIERVKPWKDEKYRITISRFSYSEIFEDYLYPSYNERYDYYTSLENTINTQSKLVTVKIYKKDGQGNIYSKYSSEGIENSQGLQEGEWYLKRSYIESYTPEMYINSLGLLKELTDIKEDFLLIPDIYKYVSTGVTQDITYISEYKTILDYTKEKNCQALISNNINVFGSTGMIEVDSLSDVLDKNYIYHTINTDDVSYNWWNGEKWIKTSSQDSRWTEFVDGYGKNNYLFNFVDDRDNRLVYFYGDIEYYGYQRPSYFMFLNGILDDKYSENVDYINYESPITNPYDDLDSDPLEEKKSNYLCCNEHVFYYKQFFSHPGDYDYITTIHTRFVMDKVTNTVEREFKQFLSLTTYQEIISGMTGILKTLQNRFSIIHNLTISGLDINYLESKVDIEINVYISELIEKNIKLNITLNINS